MKTFFKKLQVLTLTQKAVAVALFALPMIGLVCSSAYIAYCVSK